MDIYKRRNSIRIRAVSDYIKSISVEEDSKRLNLLHETIVNCGFEKLDDEYVKE
jgi:hypothetical protein